MGNILHYQQYPETLNNLSQDELRTYGRMVENLLQKLLNGNLQ